MKVSVWQHNELNLLSVHIALYYGFAFELNKTDSDMIAGHPRFGISDTKTMKNVNKGV